MSGNASNKCCAKEILEEKKWVVSKEKPANGDEKATAQLLVMKKIDRNKHSTPVKISPQGIRHQEARKKRKAEKNR